MGLETGTDGGKEDEHVSVWHVGQNPAVTEIEIERRKEEGEGRDPNPVGHSRRSSTFDDGPTLLAWVAKLISRHPWRNSSTPASLSPCSGLCRRWARISVGVAKRNFGLEILKEVNNI
ncbi:hypothetical protein U1Q18_007180 [Sarracenia purpurea var. burkii]